ncbi:prepilin peptidase [Saccharopolyspora phatthalungensis]|uniref:Leader peptidase (Prepilin peptidase)/N-methyltransferase n=1 Tax=Saccharopolyspora phatthalungensis TaxID=664693 RepID=A0A840QCB2_9PSEU|nr:A24 family peptidase [Saccharopolyspora phatthalungensis]MBB5157471.1 leader peptidase (prepilin peptidase)/N-methyltransferase [Saccharopolyspora phatthalungensis]
MSGPIRRLLAVRVEGHPLVATTVFVPAMAVLFGLLAWRLGLHVELLAYSALAAVCVPLAAIDLVEQRMPTKLLLPAYPALALLFALAAVIDHDAAAMVRSLLGMASLFVFYLVIALVATGSMGAADVLLAGLLGLALAWRGWTILAAGAILGLFYGALVGAVLIALRRASRHTPIPFGPALIAGAFTALLIPFD